ncbi:UDP-N-acetylmuramoyl-tripeptide--D-alanyl-D-alanine ligase [Nocardioides dokdonensis FR1436]|uniref:UDP-N-acetylmuramoyl-tripeptide--D-alanyl-D-alanine ligase n=1 Tax=Nocardioides dokdonensis FR1436 TaxID=1300347 RepID=A0A1A9GKP7_9ACTN|nr:UDP-N-acetylmuramoyl-tripeptide--D-alanyl-D-alanine ligase [Nocardioides dokdonensis]ANH38917.1 UDP-N-acetylmuramoyl-tripeptide--D-alanyl-D-alanine ligase [Nocardioides dokdonensis FR1436]
MIALTLARIAEVVGGEVVADPPVASEPVTVTGPVVIDSREARPGGLFVAFVGERTDGHEHVPQAAEAGAVAVLGSRPTTLPTVVVADPQQALQRLAAHVVAEVRRAGRLTVLAITGSQGKTSTKDLLGAVLEHAAPTVATRGSFNNELGMPLTALRTEADTRFLVLELGARGRGHIAELTDLVRPDISVVLNVGQAHLGEFGSQDAIAEAKGELVQALTATGTAVLNHGDERVAAMARLTDGSVVTFGDGAGADVRVEDLTLDRLGRPSFVLATPQGSVPVALQVVGSHQALNAAAACAAALAAGLDPAQVAQALDEVTTLSQWRMELRELDRGVIVLNDSYNANPESMRAALDALASIGADPGVRRTVAVLGEMRELGDSGHEEHEGVGSYAAALGVDLVVVVGDAAHGIRDGAGERAVAVADNVEAVAWVQEHIGDGDAVLFKASRGARLDEVAAALQ